MSSNVASWSTSVIRWAGSKRRIIPIITTLAPPIYERYVEPFCGSATVLFAIRPTSAYLGDINPELINALRMIREQPDELYSELSAAPVTICYYNNLRAKAYQHCSDFDRAVRFLYLNRYCFNGVYRTNRSGHFNVPMGKKTGQLPPRASFLRCADTLKGAELFAGDFSTTIDQCKENDFVYLDPPYVKNGARNRGEYGVGSFVSADIGRLISQLHLLDDRNVKFLLSYANENELLKKLPPRWNIRTIEVGRHISGFRAAEHHTSEILVRNYQ